MSMREYTCIPIGKLIDMMNAHAIINGADEAEEDMYIPSLR